MNSTVIQKVTYTVMNNTFFYYNKCLTSIQTEISIPLVTELRNPEYRPLNYSMKYSSSLREAAKNPTFYGHVRKEGVNPSP